MELRPSSHGFIIARSAKVSVEEGTIAQDRIVNMDRLSTARGSLRTQLGGKFAPSVVVGLPPQTPFRVARYQDEHGGCQKRFWVGF